PRRTRPRDLLERPAARGPRRLGRTIRFGVVEAPIWRPCDAKTFGAGRRARATMGNMSRVSRRVGAITESATLAVDAKYKALQAAGVDVIGFGAGEAALPTPAHLVGAGGC